MDEVSVQQHLERLMQVVIDAVEGHRPSRLLVLFLSHLEIAAIRFPMSAKSRIQCDVMDASVRRRPAPELYR